MQAIRLISILLMRLVLILMKIGAPAILRMGPGDMLLLCGMAPPMLRKFILTEAMRQQISRMMQMA